MQTICVLDFDETLGTSEKCEGKDKCNIYFEDGTKYKTVLRPLLQPFLNFLRENFDVVGIWSAGETDYVEKVIKLINFLFVRSRLIQ